MTKMTEEHVGLSELLDRQAIRDVVLRYCRGIDRMDRDLVRACYHSDAIDHHVGFSGTVDEFIEWCWPGLAQMHGTRHVMANHLCEVSRDAAVAESYVLTYHWGDPADGLSRNFVGHGRYVDRFERREDRVWRIAERRVIAELITEIGIPPGSPGSGPVPGRGDRTDPVYAMASELDGDGVIG